MSLPAAYKIPNEYFADAVRFLKEHAWIYKYSNTNFLRKGVFEKFPEEFIKYFQNVTPDELNIFPLVHEYDIEYPVIKDFRSKLKSLIPTSLPINTSNIPSNINQELTHKVGLKKKNEIMHLAKLISERCDHNNVYVDLGAGIGYLSGMLYELNKDCCILGLESDAYRVGVAQKRQQELLPQASSAILYKEVYVTENWTHYINETAQELFKLNKQTKVNENQSIPPPNMAIIGLHACADLTVTAMRLFLRLERVRKLIIMPCCYHKMERTIVNPFETESFENFPLSECLKSALHDADAEYREHLNRPFLRLACQQTTVQLCQRTALEQEQHGREMFQRAVVDAIIDDRTDDVIVIKNMKKKNLLQELRKESFESLQNAYTLKVKGTNKILPWYAEHEEKFNAIMKKYKDGYKLAEGLTCLQTTMQKLCENLVLLDRLCYLQESAAALKLTINAHVEKVWDEKISPRCHALIAEKL